MIFSVESGVLDKSSQNEMTPEEVRTSLMGKFGTYLGELGPKITGNRSKEGVLKERPLVTVVVSLWEEDDSMLASKMFSNSLSALQDQAKSSNMDLDFVIVVNNGGGRTEELGKNMTANMGQAVEGRFGVSNFRLVTTSAPDESNNPSVPWKAEIPLSEPRAEGQSRCFLVVQPFDKLNAGKVRALRDISSSLHREIFKGYTPDAIFQMDAETILEYQKTHLKLLKSPFRAMYDALKRRDGVVAIGTKDRFDPMDPETGKALGVAMPLAQELYTQINRGTKERFITLPGGAILAEPHYYIAGMEAISTTTPGDVAEDYLFTQMLREYAKDNNHGEIVKINSLNVITHLNRCPEGDDAVRQILRWKRQGAAVDQIFPDFKYEDKPLLTYAKLLLKARLKKAAESKDRKEYWARVVADIKSIPGIVEIITDKEIADLIKGNASWTHLSKN